MKERIRKPDLVYLKPQLKKATQYKTSLFMVLKKGNRVCTKGVTLPKHIHFNGSHFHAVEVEPDAQNLLLINGRFPTISSNFSTNYMNIFHKTEFQTIILGAERV